MSKTKSTHTHIQNVVRIAIGQTKPKPKRRYRRRNPIQKAITEKSLPYNKLLEDIARLTSKTYNVSNPSNSNSSTLINKIDEIKNKEKIKELEHQLATKPKLLTAPSPEPSRPQPTLMNSLGELEQYLSLRDRAMGLTQEKDKPKNVYRQVEMPFDSLSKKSSRPIIEEVATSIGRRTTFGGTETGPLIQEIQQEEKEEPPPLFEVGSQVGGGGGSSGDGGASSVSSSKKKTPEMDHNFVIIDPKTEKEQLWNQARNAGITDVRDKNNKKKSLIPSQYHNIYKSELQNAITD